MPPSQTTSAINFSWLIQLRWGAIAGQVVTILGVARLMHVVLPLTPLLAIITVELLSNLGCVALVRGERQVEPFWAGAVMVLDTVLLTGLLYFAGGPFNPFSFLYLVQISLAAVILSARWTWALVVLSLAGSGFLFLDHRALTIDGSHAEHMSVHLRGMWVAFGVAATFIVYFLLRVRRSLAEREADLAEARHLAAQKERLASLATLAAGAAHELATPLSTIALVAKELERNSEASAQPSVLEDIRLVRAEVERCRRILGQLASDAGAPAGESLVELDAGELIAGSLEGIREQPRVELELGDGQPSHRLTLPRRAVAQAIGSLVKNAQDASPPDVPVLVRAAPDGGFLRVEVRDRGSGMAPSVLSRAGEPFFTTKPPGRGMGLGLFLTRTIVERVGGELRIESAPGRGTLAIVRLPLGAKSEVLRG